MSITDTLEDLVVAKWAPGDWLEIQDVVALSRELEITDARSTVQRTMQELRDRGILRFIDNQGNYQRLPVADENRTSIQGRVADALTLRNRRFAYRPRLQVLVDERLGRLRSDFVQQWDTSLRDIPAIVSEFSSTKTEAVTNVMTRLGQGQFRDSLIAYWGACAVTGCKLLPLLRASHIKPWCVSNDTERLDVYNGILLVPHLDVLFDEGLISFDNDGRMLVSEFLDIDNRKLFRVPVRTHLRVAERHVPYLTYHRVNIFISGEDQRQLAT